MYILIPVRKTFIMSITHIYVDNIGILQHENTYDFLVQVRNFFLLPLSLKVFQHKERVTPDFSICPKPRAHTTQGHWPGFGKPRKSTIYLRARNSTNRLFSNLLTLPVHDITHIPGHIPIWDFYCDISEWHVRSARTCEHLRSCLHLTNPCTEPKGSQPN